MIRALVVILQGNETKDPISPSSGIPAPPIKLNSSQPKPLLFHAISLLCELKRTLAAANTLNSLAQHDQFTASESEITDNRVIEAITDLLLGRFTVIRDTIVNGVTALEQALQFVAYLQGTTNTIFST